MTDDQPDADDSGGGFEGGDSGGRSGGSGGGGGLFSLLPLIFGLIRGPKSLLLIVALGIGAYFFQDGEEVATSVISHNRFSNWQREEFWIPVSLINQKFTNPFRMMTARIHYRNLLIF